MRLTWMRQRLRRSLLWRLASQFSPTRAGEKSWFENAKMIIGGLNGTWWIMEAEGRGKSLFHPASARRLIVWLTSSLFRSWRTKKKSNLGLLSALLGEEEDLLVLLTWLAGTRLQRSSWRAEGKIYLGYLKFLSLSWQKEFHWAGFVFKLSQLTHWYYLRFKLFLKLNFIKFLSFSRSASLSLSRLARRSAKLGKFWHFNNKLFAPTDPPCRPLASFPFCP